MIKTLEDILSSDERVAIDAVLSSTSVNFSELVRISGLNPNKDFRFSDLRGTDLRGADLRFFDFTGSDLRDCFVDSKTIIDATTVFGDDSMFEFIEVESESILDSMHKIQVASGSDGRTQAIDRLISTHGMTTHVTKFLFAAACDAESLDEYLDFALYMQPVSEKNQIEQLRNIGLKLLRKKINQSRGGRKDRKPSSLAMSGIENRIQHARNSFAAQIYLELASVIQRNATVRVLNDISSIEHGQWEAAFNQLGRPTIP